MSGYEMLHNPVLLPKKQHWNFDTPERRKLKHTSWQILLIAIEAFQLLHYRRSNFQIKVET